MRNIGRTQPPRQTVFEPMVFALARLEPKLPPRIGCQQSRILKQVANSKRLLDKSLPRGPSATEPKASWVCPFRVEDPSTGRFTTICKQANPAGLRNCSNCQKRRYDVPHASTVRGRAAVIAMRKAKTPKMPDKSPLINLDLCENWGAKMFEPKGF